MARWRRGAMVPLLVLLLILAGCGAQTATTNQALSGGTAAAIGTAAFGPGGALLATANPDTTITIWDTTSGERKFTLAGHGGEVTAISFSADGKLLASGGADKRVAIWDTTTGQELRALGGHTGTVNAVAFRPDGQTLASGGQDGSVRLWSVSSGTMQKSLAGSSGGVTSLAFSPNGQSLASGGADATVKLWNTSSGDLTRQYRGHKDAIGALAFSPDGQSLASGGKDRQVKLWSATSDQELRDLSGHTGALLAISFSPDGQSLATGSDDRTAKIWDARSGLARQTLSGHTAAVPAVIFQPDGKSLLSGSRDNSARQWDANTGSLQRSIAIAPLPTSEIDGFWESNYGPVVLHTQPGSGNKRTVTGYWDQVDPSSCAAGTSCLGQITSGEFDPATKRLTIAYSQPWNQVTGTAEFTLNEQGDELRGTYSQQGGGGNWVLTRPQQSPTASAAPRPSLAPTVARTVVPAAGTITPNGPSVLAKIARPDQEIRLTFPGAARRRFSATITDSTLAEADVTLLGPDGATIEGIYIFNPDNTFGPFTLEASGTYTLTLKSRGGITGEATLTVYDFVDATGKIAPGGAPVQAAIQTPGQRLNLTFEGKTGQFVSVQVAAMNVAEADLILYSPTGNQVQDIYMSDADTFFDTVELPDNGTYTLTLDPRQAMVGGATLTAYLVNHSHGEVTIGGAPVQARIATPGQNAYWTFTTGNGRAVVATVDVLGVTEADILIFNADGTLAEDAYISANGQSLAVTLPAGGTYTLAFDPRHGYVGTATISLR